MFYKRKGQKRKKKKDYGSHKDNNESISEQATLNLILSLNVSQLPAASGKNNSDVDRGSQRHTVTQSQQKK